MTVSVEILAEFFGKTSRTMQLWAENQGMPKDSHGEYDLFECAKWRIKKLEEENEILRNSGDEKLHSLKMEGQRISNEERKVKLRKLIGELIDMEAVRIAWTNETKNFRKALTALESKLDFSLDGVEDRITRKKIISDEVRNILKSLGELRIDLDDDTDELINDFRNDE